MVPQPPAPPFIFRSSERSSGRRQLMVGLYRASDVLLRSRSAPIRWVDGVPVSALHLPRLDDSSGPDLFLRARRSRWSDRTAASWRNLGARRSSSARCSRPRAGSGGRAIARSRRPVRRVERFHGNAVIDRGPWLPKVWPFRGPRFLARLAPLWRRNSAHHRVPAVCIVVLALWISADGALDLNRLRGIAQLSRKATSRRRNRAPRTT